MDSLQPRTPPDADARTATLDAYCQAIAPRAEQIVRDLGMPTDVPWAVLLLRRRAPERLAYRLTVGRYGADPRTIEIVMETVDLDPGAWPDALADYHVEHIGTVEPWPGDDPPWSLWWLETGGQAAPQQVVRLWRSNVIPPGHPARNPLWLEARWRANGDFEADIRGIQVLGSTNAHTLAARRGLALIDVALRRGGRPQGSGGYPTRAAYAAAILRGRADAERDGLAWETLKPAIVAEYLSISKSAMHIYNKQYGLTMKKIRTRGVIDSYLDSTDPPADLG